MSTRIYTNGWFSATPEPSNSTSIYTQGWFEASAGPPASPTDLTATAVTYTDVLLTWINNSSNEDGFRIERSLTGAALWRVIGEVGAGVVSFVDSGVIPGVGYDYRVIAFNGDGDSAPVSLINFTAPVPTEVPLGPPPTPVEPVRNRMGPIEVSYIAANVYGRESDGGALTGNKY